MKILVVKLHALGDFVIHTPAFERLRRGFPEAEITLLTTDWTVSAAIGLPFFNKIISVPSKLFFGNLFKSSPRLLGLGYRLSKAKFDGVVSFHRSKAINAFLKLSGNRSRFFSYASADSPQTVKLDETRHSAPNACDLADLLLFQMTGVKLAPDVDHLRYYWSVTQDELKEAGEIIEALGIKHNNFAMLFPGGGTNPRTTGHERRWSVGGYSKLAEWLTDQLDMEVVLAGSNDDRSVCLEVSRLSRNTLLDISGNTSIRITAALMKLSKIVFANDSAPLHISAAVGAPTVGIFGPTGSEYKLPFGSHVVGVKLGLPCSPCYYGVFNGCIFNTIRCMEELSPQLVIETAKSLYSQLPVKNE